MNPKESHLHGEREEEGRSAGAVEVEPDAVAVSLHEIDPSRFEDGIIGAHALLTREVEQSVHIALENQ